MTLTISHTTPSNDVETADFSIPEFLQEIANKNPQTTALLECKISGEPGASITYSELHSQAEDVACWLLQHYEPGNHIAIWAPNSLSWFLLQLGTSYAGMTLVTVNPNFLQGEAEYVLNHSGSRAVFTISEYRSMNHVETSKTISSESNTLKDVYDIDEIMQQILAEGKELRAKVQLPTISPDTACMIQYTSGTTGQPKGAELSHRAVLNYAKFAEAGVALPTGSKWVNFVPMFHTGGCIYMALGCLWNQGTHLLLDGFDPEFTLQVVEKHQAHFLWCVPTMYYSMLELENFDSYDKSSLEVVASGATTVPPELVNKLETQFTGEFVMLFGQTECGMICQTTRNDTIEHQSTTVGKAMPHMEIKIADRESFEPLPIGEIGEICVRSVSVMNGYYNRPDATAETIDKDGWLHTGDLGVMDEDGYCKITGRAKDMIIRGGENIFPREIEDVLINHEEVLDVAVFGIPDDKWGEQVAAAIRLSSDSKVTDEALMDYLREHIARHKVPRVWMRLDSFPLTTSGKVKKFELKEMYLQASN